MPQSRTKKGSRRALRPRGRYGKTLRDRNVPGSHARSYAHIWWFRLYKGIQCRALLPRCAFYAGRRGHKRNPAPGDCTPIVGKIQNVDTIENKSHPETSAEGPISFS